MRQQRHGRGHDACTGHPGVGGAGRAAGTGGITTAEKRELLAILRLLAAGNDAAMAAYDRLAALWGITQPDNKTTARLSLAVLGRMILGRS